MVVTNSCALLTSSTATLTVNTAPSITQQPVSQVACDGTQVTFSVTAGGTTPLSYQWRKNLINIPGATLDTFTIPAVSVADEGDYDIVVTNLCGSVTSVTAVLTIDVAPSITQQPITQNACESTTVIFTVSAIGQGTLSYQWRKNGVDIPGATSPTHTIPFVIIADEGIYTVLVVSSV